MIWGDSAQRVRYVEGRRAPLRVLSNARVRVGVHQLSRAVVRTVIRGGGRLRTGLRYRVREFDVGGFVGVDAGFPETAVQRVQREQLLMCSAFDDSLT